MSGCLDKVECRCDCDCWQALKDRLTPKRNMLASVVSGILVSFSHHVHMCVRVCVCDNFSQHFVRQFSAGWWAVIDSFTDHIEPIYASYFISGILSTIALLM